MLSEDQTETWRNSAS